MPEPNEQTPEVELATLRKLRDELLAKTHTQKARIETLESEALQLTEARDNANAKVRAVVIDQPLKRMVADLNKSIPELVMRELQADFIFDADDAGAIIIKTKADDKPIAAKNGKPVAFDKLSIWQFLIGDGYAEKSERQKVYTALLGIPAASGGVGRKSPLLGQATRVTGDDKKDDSIHFGLR